MKNEKFPARKVRVVRTKKRRGGEPTLAYPVKKGKTLEGGRKKKKKGPNKV